ncbi:MAG: AsmA-like C-terminal region-containing protein [bacterium]|nr:AsmA-like C-terminal region-containing protein [bacterium]
MRYGRYARFWLLALLVLTAIFTGTALFTKYRLESLRGDVLNRVERRTGTRVAMEAVSVTGLRGFRIEGFDASFQTPAGPMLYVQVPEVLIFIDLVGLFSGELTVERIQADGAVVRVVREEGESWRSSSPTFRPRSGGAQAVGALPNRLLGKNCTVIVADPALARPVTVSGLSFDVARAPETGQLSATLAGLVDGDPTRRVQASVQVAPEGNYDVDLDLGHLRAVDVQDLYPRIAQFGARGTVHPRIRVEGRPGRDVDASLTAEFEGLYADAAEGFLDPVEGALTAFVTYDLPSKSITVNMFQVECDQLEANVNGSVSLATGTPRFNLRAQAGRLPLDRAVARYADEVLPKYGAYEALFEEPEVTLSLTGTWEDRVLAADAALAGAEVSFTPRKKEFPAGTVRLGPITASWNSAESAVRASAIIQDGSVTHDMTSVNATRLSGSVTLTGDTLEAGRVTADIAGQPFVASATYNLKTRKGAATLDGTLTGVEDTPLGTSIKKTELMGSASLSAKVTLAPDLYVADAFVDGSQLGVEYDWWLLKPIGIGATSTAHVEMAPRKSIVLDAETSLAGSALVSHVELAHNGTRWILKLARSDSERMDVVTVGKCLRLPFTITGGTATNGFHEWRRLEDDRAHWMNTMGCEVDELQLRADGAEHGFDVRGAYVESEMVNNEEDRSGKLDLTIENATTPPFGGTWFVPMRTDPVLNEKYPQKDRDWKYALSAKSIAAPPWKGSEFSATGYGSMAVAGLDKYDAAIDGGGRVAGRYHRERAENSYESHTEWDGIPVDYLIEHLNFPEILTGKTTGFATWSQDSDDPRTLDGKGSFEVADGQFSADYLAAQMEEMEGEAATLPPSLKFRSLGSDVEFKKDLVKTPNLQLRSEGITVIGNGQFVTEGDMDYDIRVRVTPEMAMSIPALREGINVEGHRLAQQDIELAFKVSGPTLRPRSELAQVPPVSVTLVTGALEVTSTALEVIDTPRKLLLDLLRIGGGIVGPKKRTVNGNP